MRVSINFFDKKWVKEPARTDRLFGVNDGNAHAQSNDEKMARTTIEGDSQKWNALVINDHAVKLQFIPIDHNLDGGGLCDGLLYSENQDNLIFIELKTGKKNWITEGIKQLEKSISLFTANHDIKQFKQVNAYLCNNHHPNFQTSHREEMQMFRNKNKVRLYIERKIVVSQPQSHQDLITEGVEQELLHSFADGGGWGVRTIDSEGVGRTDTRSSAQSR